MGCEIIEMKKGAYRIEDGGVRFFLLEGESAALLIDSGMTVRNAKEIAQSLTDKPVSLLNTHADRDHIGSNAEFETVFMHPLEEPNYRRAGMTEEIDPVEEGDVLDLGERELEIIHLPGHTPGSIAVLDIRNRILISGDPIQENGRIFMFGEHRNMRDYIKSLKDLEKRTAEFDEIWPSHAAIPISPDLIGKCREGAEKILAGEVPGTPAQMGDRRFIVRDLGFTAFLCGEQEEGK